MHSALHLANTPVCACAVVRQRLDHASTRCPTSAAQCSSGSDFRLPNVNLWLLRDFERVTHKGTRAKPQASTAFNAVSGTSLLEKYRNFLIFTRFFTGFGCCCGRQHMDESFVLCKGTSIGYSETKVKRMWDGELTLDRVSA